MLSTGKLGFWGLTALVFGLVVGVGIYNLPQNMAAVASPAAVGLSWLITGAGILPLVFVFKYLSEEYPQLNAGIYQYAQAGLGRFAGFNIAWGYWLCSAFSNVTYGVMLNDSVGAFFPVLHEHGVATVIFCSLLIWTMYWIVSRGIKTAKFINNMLAVIKIMMLVLIIAAFFVFFRADIFEMDFRGNVTGLGNLGTQVRSTMMITLFCFFGVEGAVMMSARARKASDVGKAGIAGFFIALLLYMSVSLLCFGLMERTGLANLKDPSIAYILRSTCGEWSYWFVISAVIISLLGGWVAWTLVVSQVPYEASLTGIFPRCFSRLNGHNMPAFGLVASSLAMEVFLLLVVMADDVYLAALNITGLMVIPCYFCAGLFLWKKGKKRVARLIGLTASLFCLWMAYAGGIPEMIMTSGFYLAGIFFYLEARREQRSPDAPLLTRRDKYGLAILCASTVFSVYLILQRFF